jgi:hypothetical protein
VNDKKDVPEKTDRNSVETDEKSRSLTEACSVMKEQIKDKAQQDLVGQTKLGKPKSLTDACEDMKEEIKDEAQRLVPGRETKERSKE